MKRFNSYEEMQAYIAMEEAHDEYVKKNYNSNSKSRNLADYYGYQDDDEYGHEQFLDDM